MNNDYIINLFKSQESDYKFDKSLMRKYLLDYYYSRDSFCKYEYSYQSYNRDAIFGLKYYDYLLYDLKESERPDIRLYHILFDQKTLMDYRFKYLATLKEQFDPDKMQKLITM
ncbi:MAG: hypothetical protein K2J60_07805, partial [Acetatifactor sp.]|nr:hypothetical protein [Acetatifactor sp.]